MIGTYLNVAAIVAGGIYALAGGKSPSAANQSWFKLVLGMLTGFFGLRLAWISLNGSPGQILKELGVVVLAMMVGKVLGRLLRLQKKSNQIGQLARERIAGAGAGQPNQFLNGFTVCSALFCAAPLGLLGAVLDGLTGDWAPLAVKAAMEGLAAMSFVAIFGRGVLFSAVPVLVFQGTVSLACARFLLPGLAAHHLVEAINVTGGLLIFCVALLILEFRKVEVTDYLPSLALAPLLTWWWLR